MALRPVGITAMWKEQDNAALPSVTTAQGQTGLPFGLSQHNRECSGGGGERDGGGGVGDAGSE